jgi:hypothetical protein
MGYLVWPEPLFWDPIPSQITQMGREIEEGKLRDILVDIAGGKAFKAV